MEVSNLKEFLDEKTSIHFFFYCIKCRRIAVHAECNSKEDQIKIIESLNNVDGGVYCQTCNSNIKAFIANAILKEGKYYMFVADCGMFPKKLYHYTSLSNMMQILQNRTLRLNRLDRVNDSSDGMSTEFRQAFKFVFVSCWTYDPSENILHWGRYTQDCGCRLEIPRDMFIKRPDVTNDLILVEQFNDITTAIEFSEPLTDIAGKLIGIKLKPNFGFPTNGLIANIPILYLFGPTFVSYHTDELELLPKTSLDSRTIDLRTIGVRKFSFWKEEKEIRFRFLGTSEDIYEGYGEETYFDKHEIISDYLDIPLAYDALNEAVITFGPLTEKKDAKKLINYCKKEYPSIKFKESQIKMRKNLNK